MEVFQNKRARRTSALTAQNAGTGATLHTHTRTHAHTHTYTKNSHGAEENSETNHLKFKDCGY